MEALGLCEICGDLEGYTFDESDLWICDRCDYEQNYRDIDTDEEEGALII